MIFESKLIYFGDYNLMIKKKQKSPKKYVCYSCVPLLQHSHGRECDETKATTATLMIIIENNAW